MRLPAVTDFWFYLFDAALVLALMVIAAVVLVGLSRRRNMWRWIVTYWAVLTVRNAVTLMMGVM